MTRLPFVFIAWIALLGQSQPQGQTAENVIHVNVNLVQVDAVVTDSFGKP
jgi:hypothetical protein